MVERVARSMVKETEDGHHVLETELRNESGKVLTQDTVGAR